MKIVYDDTSVTVSQLNPSQVNALLAIIDEFVAEQFKIPSKYLQHTEEKSDFDYLLDEYFSKNSGISQDDLNALLMN